MNKIIKKIKKTFTAKIVYKLLVDIFFLSLIVTALFIALDNLIPNILDAYISPFKLFAFLFIIFGIIIYTANRLEISFKLKKSKRWMLVLSLLLFTFAVTIAGIRGGLAFDIITTTFSLLTFLLLIKISARLIR